MDEEQAGTKELASIRSRFESDGLLELIGPVKHELTVLGFFAAMVLIAPLGIRHLQIHEVSARLAGS